MAVIWGTKAGENLGLADGVTDKADVIFGLDGNDTIWGHGGDDVMKGGGGTDTFHGGAGVDEVDYSDSLEPVVVDLTNGQNGHTRGGTAEGDTFYGVENVTGSLYDDYIYGTELANTLRGAGGEDHLYGLGDADILEGGDGYDSLHGGSGADKLYGGNNDDYLFGGAGADQLFGGDGDDTADYRESTAVTVLLQYNLAFKGDAEGDTFSSIENLVGTSYDDLLGGNDSVNWIHGNEGNDKLKGFGGDDILQGGPQDDTLIGGGGRDSLIGGGEADKFVWASTDETGVTPFEADLILDFDPSENDRIDLSGIDADIYGFGNQSFTFIGTLDFTLNPATPANTDVMPGEIRYYHASGYTFIEMNTGDDPNVDAVIGIEGIVTPQAGWFVL